ncbi:MAG: ATPase-like protein [Sphingomonas bacterium]|nr:ATPase-like protein [Sphingomonas bacterium]
MPDPFSTARDADLITCRFKRPFKGEVKLEIPESPIYTTTRVSVPDYELLMGQAGPSAFSPLAIFFRGLFDEIVSCGAYSIYPNRIREPQAISNLELLTDDGANLASIIRQMRSTTFRRQKEQLTNAVSQVLPIVEQINIEQAGGFYVPVFQVREVNDGHAHNLNMSQLSDGTLRMLGMLTAFYQPRAPERITLEEPEQMIHPGLLPVLIESGRDYLDLKPGRQILYTTHSPVFLDMFDTSSIIGATFDEGISHFSPMSPRQKKVVESKLFSAGALLVAEGIAG